MKIPYFPGCTLNTTAKGFDNSLRASARVLGIELAELPEWNCCGATFPLLADNVLDLAGPASVLVATFSPRPIENTKDSPAPKSENSNSADFEKEEKLPVCGEVNPTVPAPSIAEKAFVGSKNGVATVAPDPPPTPGKTICTASMLA